MKYFSYLSVFLLLMLFVGCSYHSGNSSTKTDQTEAMEASDLKDNHDVYLDNLEVLMTYGGGMLNPVFSKEIFNYTINVNSDISYISLIPTADDESKLISSLNQRIKSGSEFGVDLKTGDNPIDINIFDEQGNKTVYHILIKRQDSQAVIDKFLSLTYQDKDTGSSMNYRLFIPENYDEAKSYPLILFLHGYGEMGSDNVKQLVNSQGATIWATDEEQEKRTCFVLAPQSQNTGWTSISTSFENPFTPLSDLDTAYKILESVKKSYNINENQIYSTGVSMGGFGVLALNIMYPDLFAAIVPVCGGADVNKVEALKDIPIWIFHAESDPTVKVSFSDDVYNKLLELGAKPKYTRYTQDIYFYPNGHFAWVPAYADEEMREWLFAQNR